MKLGRLSIATLLLAMLITTLASCNPAAQPTKAPVSKTDQSGEAGTAKTGDEPDASVAPKEGIDPKTDEVVTKTSDYLRGLNGYGATMEMKFDTGEGNEQTHTIAARVKTPNLFAMETQQGGDEFEMAMYSDGSQLTTYYGSFNKYTVGSADELQEQLTGAGAPTLGGPTFFIPPAHGNIRDSLLEGVKATQYVGTEKLDGVECHRMKFVQDNIDWELWVQTGEKPLPRQMKLDMSKAFKAQFAGNEDAADAFDEIKMEMNIAFNDWKINPGFTDEDFHFTPPEGAEKVDSVMDMIGGTGEEAVHGLVGKSAPPFQLKTLDGKEIKLADHAGNEIVILDFWATWCGPCVKALPTLAKVAEQFKDKGVVFYAVNLQEEEDQIREFLKTQGLDVPVILDSDASVSEAYLVTGIPQTVVIGADGTVQVVHVGLLPNLEQQLTEELDALLGGEDLAAKTLAEAAEKPQDAAEAPAEPAVEPTEPAIEASEPAVEATEPAVETTEPAVDDAEAPAEPAATADP